MGRQTGQLPWSRKQPALCKFALLAARRKLILSSPFLSSRPQQCCWIGSSLPHRRFFEDPPSRLPNVESIRVISTNQPIFFAFSSCRLFTSICGCSSRMLLELFVPAPTPLTPNLGWLSIDQAPKTSSQSRELRERSYRQRLLLWTSCKRWKFFFGIDRYQQNASVSLKEIWRKKWKL